MAWLFPDSSAKWVSTSFFSHLCLDLLALKKIIGSKYFPMLEIKLMSEIIQELFEESYSTKNFEDIIF